MRISYYYNNFRTFNIVAVSVFILFLIANAGIYFIFEIILASILILASGNLGIIFALTFLGNKLISILDKINEISNIPENFPFDYEICQNFNQLSINKFSQIGEEVCQNLEKDILKYLEKIPMEYSCFSDEECDECFGQEFCYNIYHDYNKYFNANNLTNIVSIIIISNVFISLLFK